MWGGDRSFVSRPMLPKAAIGTRSLKADPAIDSGDVIESTGSAAFLPTRIPMNNQGCTATREARIISRSITNLTGYPGPDGPLHSRRRGVSRSTLYSLIFTRRFLSTCATDVYLTLNKNINLALLRPQKSKNKLVSPSCPSRAIRNASMNAQPQPAYEPAAGLPRGHAVRTS